MFAWGVGGCPADQAFKAAECRERPRFKAAVFPENHKLRAGEFLVGVRIFWVGLTSRSLPLARASHRLAVPPHSKIGGTGSGVRFPVCTVQKKIPQ